MDALPSLDFSQLLLVTTRAAWNVWHSMTKQSSFLHFDLTLINALVGEEGSRKQRVKLICPESQKLPSCTLLKQKNTHTWVSVSLPLSWDLIYKHFWSGPFFPKGKIPIPSARHNPQPRVLLASPFPVNRHLCRPNQWRSVHRQRPRQSKPRASGSGSMLHFTHKRFLLTLEPRVG